MNSFPKLFIPGPTHVSQDILDTLSMPQIGHRTPEISQLINDITLVYKIYCILKIMYMWFHMQHGIVGNGS